METPDLDTENVTPPIKKRKLQRKRSDSPEPSCVSMKSDASMIPPQNFRNKDSSSVHSKLQRKRSDSPEPSCVSMKSDASMIPPQNFRNKDSSSVHSVVQKSGDRREKNIITATGHDPEPAAVNDFQKKFKLNLVKKFQCLNGVMINPENQTLLNEIYTELYITEGDSGDVSKEHEVRQIEGTSRRTTTEETPIKCNDIFKPLSDQDKPIRTVLTKGVAGIGKTVTVQKFILDWAEGKVNQDVQLMFLLPFRELNLMKDQKLSLMDLLHVCFKETKETEMSSLEKVLFIFDGLDECRFPLDFQNTERVCDVTESASVHVLLINLIKGNLLPSALIWITSRPAAADQIPSECVHRVTEVRGFNDPQKEEYFRKRISDQSLANNIITHLKSLRSLYIMCHIPVFCWISATVLERMLDEAESGEMPKTLTQMYTHFLIIQTNIIREKYSKKQENDEEMLLKLGHLAFQQLMKGNLIFYEEDLRECGIDVREAAVYSGVCTQIFREEFGLHQSKVYCFVHLSIQEHLAALYVHLTFMKEKRNVLEQSRDFKTISDVHKSAVHQALKSQTGHLDLFLRFLLGLSLESNQKLLHALVTHTGSSSQTGKGDTVQYIKEMISGDLPTEKSINLFHCLNELGDNSLVEEIQRYLKSGTQSELSSSQWSALVFVLLTSAEELEEFDLSKYISTDKIRDWILVKVMPVIAASRKAIIRCDTIKNSGCRALASVLSSETSNLRELHLTVDTLDLTGNKLGDSGVKRLSALLENPQCKVKNLRLWRCDISDEGCAALTSALRSNPSHLRELDLSVNNLGDSGVKSLSAVLENLLCKLEILRLGFCGVSDEGCAALTSALRSNPSHLRELDLSENKLGDSGVKSLSAVLENPLCKLEKLRLRECGVSDEGCAALTSALRSNPSHLRELDLSLNKLGDSGVKSLAAVLENPLCKLEILRLWRCDISDEGCAALTSALRSNPSHLRELDLSGNKLGDSGVKSLSAVLENPLCKLEILNKLQRKRSDSPEPSCVSMKSDASMVPPLNFRNKDSSSVHSVVQKSGDRREKNIITATGHDPEPAAVNDFQKKFKLNLVKKFQCLNGVMINPENRTLLNEIYTELYITEGDGGDVNKEHEVRQIEAASRRTTTEETPIKCNDIFKPLSDQDKPIRTVLTKGVAGIGKTVTVQKFILDWAEGKVNQDVQLMFPLPFRELNLMKDQKLSLMDLLHVCFKETKETEMSSLEKVLFVFDGLDEYRFPLDFQNTERVCDVTESASVHVLLINLIKGNLLPSALIWITSRPAAADQIPSECVHRVTEVRGFNDPQKEEYFRKRISDQSLANNIITHLKSLRSLYIMCHIPVFCWISATVLERMLGEAESGEMPKTLTQMYTHFLIIQTNIIREKYSKKQESDEEMLLKLGRLAFQQLMKGNLIFYEEDLRECGIDVREAAVYSGVCTQIFREEFGLHQSKVYSFVHLSIQEHLAALYVHLTFMKEKRNVLEQSWFSEPEILSDEEDESEMFSDQWIEEITVSDVLKSAVDQALYSETGHLDLFLRFLLGLSLESSQKLLHSLVTHTGSSSQTGKRTTVQYIKEKISGDPPTEKSINLFHCLNELGDNSLVEEIQRCLKSGKQSELSSSQWSALVFVLLTSAEELEEFDLSKYFSTDKITDWILVKVMPVIAASRKAIIRCDTIQYSGWSALDSVLSSETSNLRELHLTVDTLDLNWSDLGDSGVKRVSALLENPQCKVKNLKLRECGVSNEGCAALTSALRSNPSHLRELNLSDNKLGVSGVKSLSAVLENPLCKLEILWLSRCDISDEGCAALTSALRSNPSHLRELNLSHNKLGDSGVKSLSAVLENPLCKLEILRLSRCDISDEGCAALTSALRSNPSHLRELNLSHNKLGDSGVKSLSAVLENPHCKLEILCKLQRKRSHSPEPSCVSMKSDESMDPPWNFRNRDSSSVHSKLQRKRSDPRQPSCVSMKSDASMGPPLYFRNKESTSVHSKLQRTRSDSPEPSCVSMKSDASMAPPLNFRNKDSSVHSVVQKSGDRREKNIITATGHDPEPAAVNEFQKKFKLNLVKKFQCLNGVMINLENRTLLNEIYTELYITEGDGGDVNKEHEVRQIEAASRRKTTEETPIKCNDIFKPLSDQDKPIRTVLTKGVAGIGKTVSVQKFILDWAEGKVNQDVQLIFPLPFRELNLMKDQKLSLMDLLHVCFKETKETEMSSLEKVLFIFDGLDECRFPLDFQNTERVCDVTESASVHVLLINLIKGNLLPSALIWITSRPAAADQIPSECVHRVTEVRGFNDPQKEEYFRKRISDQSLANNIITHLKSLRSLYIMCHIPVFCWISATVLERMLDEAESGEMPKTLTQMYTHFLIIHTNIIREKYSKKQESDEEMLLKLGRLAFQQLMKGNLIFYEEDLRECGIDVREAAVYSGVCTQIFREEFGLHQSKVYSFVHLSIQEHLAALYVHLTFMKEKRNVLEQSRDFKTISDVHESAVDQALKSETGHLDLFLRFLLGLSLESNQKLLHALVTHTGSSSQTGKSNTVQYIKRKISGDPPTEKAINLFHCLNELGDNSLVEEIQRYLKSGTQSELSSSQWSALVFVLLTSAEELEEFDLSKYFSTDKIRDQILVNVMPVIAASRKAIIRCDTIQERGWRALDSVLSSETSNLRELHLTVDTLDLTGSDLGDSGVKRLSALLENPQCKVKNLRLSRCDISDEGCAALTSALRSNPSHLRELDLSHNNLGDSGVKSVSAVLENPLCKLEILELRGCGVSGEGCAPLTSALRSNPSHLRKLYLSLNNLGDSGVKSLSAVLENPLCNLEILCVLQKSGDRREKNIITATGKLQKKRSDSPEPSCVSMKSDASMESPLTFRNKDSSSVHRRSDSPEPSCVSMKSDASMGHPENFRNKDSSSVHSVLQKSGDRREKNIITATGHDPEPAAVNDFQKKFKLNLVKKFQCLNGVMINLENRTLLNEIYTELYITEGDIGDVTKEHEVRQIEAASRRTTTEETPIKCNDIFKPLPDQDKPIRTVLTKGVAGIGKTVSVQKFILDWAEGEVNQDVQLMFPLPFRELNLMKDQKLSLMDLLHVCFKETKETEMSSLEKVLFIFDGLDEYRFPLDFQNTERVCDVTESASVHVLLINLIKGNLLPSALIWITSRPAAADQIPSECVHRVTEVRGFNDPQKEEYFRKRISDQSLANNIITHLKSLRSLYIMCHIPVFCWISATVLERMLDEAESGEMPKTLTQMYTYFLIIQTNIIREKYSKKQESDEEMLLKLGQLAFQQLMKGNLIFYEEDLRECGIDVREAAVYSGVCTQIFREEFTHQSKVYCFVHLSIQEHLAALYVHLTFMKEKRNVLIQSRVFKTISDVHKSAVYQALKSQTGHLDLFLRFLLGLSLESNQKLLHALVTHTGSISQTGKGDTVQYIKEKISGNTPTEKSINLFHCLNELEDNSLVEEIQRYLKSGKQSELSSSQWSALVFVLLTSAEELEEFDLSKYISTDKIRDEILVKVMPVIAASRKAVIRCDTIQKSGWSALASVLSSETSNLRELHLTVDTLDLSGNKLGDSGVKRLSAPLENPQCKVKNLKLRNCGVSSKGCSGLTSALRSNPSHLRELHLSGNYLGDSGVKSLSAGLENPHCKLEILKLEYCDISDEGCAALVAALRSNPSHLRKLDLSINKLGESGVKCLSAVLENPLCKLEKLNLRECGIIDEGCAALTSALRSNHSHLRELDLSWNKLGDSGVKCLSAGLENPLCKLEILGLWSCGVSDEGCAALTSALRSNPSHLRELDLSGNKLGDSGVKCLSAVLENPHCKLEILKLCNCGVSDEGCAALTSALRSNPSHLRELDLSEKKLGDSGVKSLSAVLENPLCKLEILGLYDCGVSDEGCAALASALRSNPSHLRELNLSKNELGDSGVKCLSAGLEHPHCKLEILKLWNCDISGEGCAALTSALRSNPLHLRELDLSENKLGDSGVKSLSAVLENPLCKLEKLGKLQRKRSDSPEPSCVSMKSDASMDPPWNFRNRDSSPDNSKLQRKRSDTPEPSCVSMKSDASMDPPWNFKNGNPSSVHSKLQRKRSDSPEPSCVSMKSDASMDPPWNFRNRDSSPDNSKLQRKRSDAPEPSCVSMKSDASMDPPWNFKNGNPSSVHSKLQRKRSDSPEPSCVSMKSDASMDPPWNFRNRDSSPDNSKLQRKRSDAPEPSCVSMKSDASMDPPWNFKNGNPSSVHSVLQKSGDRREKNIITATGHDPEPAAVNDFQKKFKLNLVKKFQCLNGVMINPENRTLLNEIYTELYITEGDGGDVNKEHEVRQIEAASRRTTTEETPIKCNDIFKPLSDQDKPIRTVLKKPLSKKDKPIRTVLKKPLPKKDKPIRTVLTKGVAGIGKTVSVQKFILDWAEGKANQDVQLMFPLPFRELNLMKDQKLSLMDLLHVCFKETKETEMSSLEKVLFIFDGLDECRFPLDFQNTERVCDVTESASVHVLLINLIKGNLLPSALIWITSRPAAADQIPSECVHRVTEVRGFNDPQKEEYFRKRISDQSLANNIITHLKSLRSLYIMCHIPVFCWISATVLERMLDEAESGEMPKTLTQMYTHFLIIQTNIIREKYSKKQESDEEMLLKLGQLAFQQLMKGNLIFYEEDLRECGIDVREAAVYSGVCTQIFREEFGLHQSKVYCFVHLSIQEHLAALYVHLTFMKEKRNVLEQSWVFKTISDVLKSAVDQALYSETGNLDLFLRFLLGLSLESNQNLLHSLVTHTESSSQTGKGDTVQYIKEKISRNLQTEKSINLFHCLNELGDNSLVEEIQRYLKSGTQSELSSSQWSALVFALLTSAEELEEFDLSKYISTDKITDWILEKVMPVIAASRKAIIRCDTIQNSGWSALDSVLSSETSNLRELHLTVDTLDLTGNNLGDSGVKRLSALLENPQCKVKNLKLEYCDISGEGCAALTSALRSNPSHLRELDLSRNKLGDSGVKSLSAVLENPLCKLEILRLEDCDVSDEGCAALTSALRSNPSHLRELNLSVNKLGDSGVKSLSAVLENPHCKLEILKLCKCGVSVEGCAALTSALRSNPSHLRELNLSGNKLGDSGVKSLSAVLENPLCKLEKLTMSNCDISGERCAALTSALRSNPSHLRELDLSLNKLGDSGVKSLSAVLENPLCKLEILRLCDCGVSGEGCAALASALRSNPSYLIELNVSGNEIGDLGVKCLSALKNDKQSKLQTLRLHTSLF
ncbi:uncharacterized protein LOC100526730 isoform X18 [Ictalurus punctatus]|uniref:Uncharacterized protein LOC100526730 isoform X18 n=1 Tax=Ictalurus punctatus TaxID=7998 RepID=A0A9F7RQU0_ICTPU|nr:uncharacterized protein LOC100526730 isoform X18 [Ictalurus punctatus]